MFQVCHIFRLSQTMRISATICIFGWLSLHLAKGVIMLYFGRILLGFSTGILSYVVPVFIAEIAPKNLRGGLATSNQVSENENWISTGIFIES
jgi:SP family sugar porter-like MFS transporter